MRMAKSVIVFAAAVAMLWSGGAAQTTSGCTMALVSLSPCLNYVSGNSTSPSSSCCSSLSSVVSSQPQCLCSLLNGGSSSLGIAVNQTLALALPSACSVQTPPVSRCNAGGVGGPTSAPTSPAPADSPTDEAPTTPSSVPDDNIPSDAGAGAGSKTVPTKTEEGSSNSASNAAFSVVGSILLMASSWAFS